MLTITLLGIQRDGRRNRTSCYNICSVAPHLTSLSSAVINISMRFNEYVKDMIWNLQYPKGSGAVRILDIPKYNKKTNLGPLVGGKFWAVYGYNDFHPFSDCIYMPWSEFFEIHEKVWWQYLNQYGKPINDWQQITSEKELPLSENGGLIQLYTIYKNSTINPYKFLRLKSKPK